MVRGRATVVVGLALAAVLVAAAPAGAATLYFTERVNSNVGQLHIGSGGQLEPLTPPSVKGTATEVGIAVSPDGKSVYVLGLDRSDIVMYDAAASGALTKKSPSEFLTRPDASIREYSPDIAITPSGDNVYVIGEKGGQTPAIMQTAVDSAGQLSWLEPGLLTGPADPIDLAIHPTLPKLYTASPGNDTIEVLTIGPEGKLSASTPASSVNPSSLAISPDGRFLYASRQQFISGFSIDPVTGALTPLSGSPWELLPEEGWLGNLAVTNGSVYASAYTAGESTDGVAMFTIDPLSGVLTKKSPDAVATKYGAGEIVLSPDGAYLYVGAGGSKFKPSSIEQFAVGAGGVLAPLSPARIMTEEAPSPNLAVSPLGTLEPDPPPDPDPPHHPGPKPPHHPGPPGPKPVTDYLVYRYKDDGVLSLKRIKKHGRVVRLELEVSKCYPPPQSADGCTGQVELRRAETLARGSFSIPAWKAGKLVLKPTAAGREAFEGRSVTAWLVTKLRSGADFISGQQKVEFKLK